MEQHPRSLKPEPMRIISVSGDDFEMGRQHAEQVGPAIQEGMLEFYCDFWNRIVNQQSPDRLFGMARRALMYLLDPVLVKRLRKQIPEYAMARLRGIVEVVGKNGRTLDDLITVLVLPDLLPMLGAFAARLRPSAFVDVCPPPHFGCTSFIAAGKNFLHGRNLDFPGVAYWDRFPVMQITKPKDGLSYIGFTSAGVPICGISGINEAQISMALHQHYCRESSFDGILPFIIGEKILKNARTLADAEEILKSSRVASSWAFIVTDGKSRQAFIYETHPRAGGFRRLREDDPYLVHSNYFQTPECQPSEYSTTERMNWDNHWRRARLESVVRDFGPELEPKDAVKAISDSMDGFWGQEKVMNRTVACIINTQSYVLDSERMRLWFAEGEAPIQLGKYREYDLGEILRGKTAGTGVEFEGYRYKDERKDKAKRMAVRSLISVFDGFDEQASREAAEALEYDFSPEIAQVSAVLKLKMGEYAASVELLGAARDWIRKEMTLRSKKVLPPEYFEISIFLARGLDLAGRRSEALAVYKDLLQEPGFADKHLRNLATRGKAFGQNHVHRMMMPFSCYIPFE
jgi:hypothetical protein